jgi:hypothetical protein
MPRPVPSIVHGSARAPRRNGHQHRQSCGDAEHKIAHQEILHLAAEDEDDMLRLYLRGKRN